MANFEPIVHVFGAKEGFLKKSASVSHNFYYLSSTIQKVKKTNDPIPRKHLDRGKDGHTLLCRTSRATPASLVNIVNEKFAEKRTLLLQNTYTINEISALHPSIVTHPYN